MQQNSDIASSKNINPSTLVRYKPLVIVEEADIHLNDIFS